MRDDITCVTCGELSDAELEQFGIGADELPDISRRALANSFAGLQAKWETKDQAFIARPDQLTAAVEKLKSIEHECLKVWEDRLHVIHFSSPDRASRVRSYKGAEDLKRVLDDDVLELEVDVDSNRTLFVCMANISVNDYRRLDGELHSGDTTTVGVKEGVGEKRKKQLMGHLYENHYSRKHRMLEFHRLLGCRRFAEFFDMVSYWRIDAGDRFRTVNVIFRDDVDRLRKMKRICQSLSNT